MNEKNVQVQMFNRTLLKINSIRKMFNLSSRSDVVKISVDITAVVVKAIADQDTVIIRDKDGNDSRIVIRALDK